MRPCPLPARFSADTGRDSVNLAAVKLVITPEEQRRWMEQWRHAAVALEEMKRYELRMLADEQARDLLRRELKPLLDLQEQPEKLARLEQKIRDHARPFTTIQPPEGKT